MRYPDYSDRAVTEHVAIFLILILVIALSAIIAAVFTGHLSPVPRSGYLVPKADLVDLGGYQAIRLRDAGGDPFVLNASGAPDGAYRLGITLETSAGSQPVMVLPGTDPGFRPGDQVYIYQSGTTPVLTDSPESAAPTGNFPPGSLVLVLTDEHAKTLLARIALLQSGAGPAPVPTIAPIPASSSLVNAAKGGYLAPGGALQFQVTGDYSSITIDGTAYAIRNGDTVRLVIGKNGYGSLYATSTTVGGFNFADVAVSVNGAPLATGTVSGIWISQYSNPTSTLKLVVPASPGWTQFATDGTTHIWGDDSQAISVTGITGPANLATTATTVYYNGAVSGYNLG